MTGADYARLCTILLAVLFVALIMVGVITITGG